MGTNAAPAAMDTGFAERSAPGLPSRRFRVRVVMDGSTRTRARATASAIRLGISVVGSIVPKANAAKCHRRET